MGKGKFLSVFTLLSLTLVIRGVSSQKSKSSQYMELYLDIGYNILEKFWDLELAIYDMNPEVICSQDHWVGDLDLDTVLEIFRIWESLLDHWGFDFSTYLWSCSSPTFDMPQRNWESRINIISFLKMSVISSRPGGNRDLWLLHYLLFKSSKILGDYKQESILIITFLSLFLKKNLEPHSGVIPALSSGITPDGLIVPHEPHEEAKIKLRSTICTASALPTVQSLWPHVLFKMPIN